MNWLLLFAAIEGHGDLYVYQTPECSYLIEFVNKVGWGPDQNTVINNELHVWVESDASGNDEVVYAERYGVTEKMIVKDGETGTMCVPYFMGA